MLKVVFENAQSPPLRGGAPESEFALAKGWKLIQDVQKCSKIIKF